MLEIANRFNQFGKRCRYLVNEADNLELFGDDTFDFVFSQLVLQHVAPEYSLRYVREFIRVLAPDGLIVFQVPSEQVPVAAQAGKDRSAAAGPLPPSGCTAHVAVLDCPIVQRAGSQLLLHVHVENRSDVSWPARSDSEGRHHVKVVNRWLNQHQQEVLAPDGAVLLPHDLKPGEGVDVPLVVTAPKSPGIYFLEVDVAQSAVGAFRELGSKPHSHPVEIRPQGGSDAEPQIQMLGVERTLVEEAIRDGGGTLLDVRQDTSAGEFWLSYTYWVTKKAA
jgi:SAM-dependent methyltransferase